MGTTSQTCIVAILVVQCMTVQMLRSGKRFPTCREGTAKLLLNAVTGALGAGGRRRGDGGGTGAC